MTATAGVTLESGSAGTVAVGLGCVALGVVLILRREAIAAGWDRLDAATNPWKTAGTTFREFFLVAAGLFAIGAGLSLVFWLDR